MNLDDMHRHILESRGGCRCQDPGAYPPCYNCTTPWYLSEIKEELETFYQEGATDDEVAELSAELISGRYIDRSEMLQIQQELIEEGFADGPEKA